MFDAGTTVRIEYATMAKLNKIRAWARKNNAIVNVSRYARDAYEGHVKVPSPWNEGRDQHLAKVAELKGVLANA